MQLTSRKSVESNMGSNIFVQYLILSYLINNGKYVWIVYGIDVVLADVFFYNIDLIVM